MLKLSQKLLFGAALAVMVAGSGFAQAGENFPDHEFVTLPVESLSNPERLDLNRYINYEERQQCQNYRMAPSPFHRQGCALWRGERMDYTIYFNTGSSAIRSGEQYKVNKIAKAIKKHNPREVLIVGHTDTQGSAEANQKLSMKRADAVSAALASHGITTTIIDDDAVGEYDLAVETGDGVANQSNRRVTVLLRR
ncbi:MAG: OmpA family protein [Rhodospirillales bacterium]|nr:OmpA family protein [Rhodospirillales bacterium]